MTENEILRRHHVRVSGKGERTVLFAHGFGCDQNMWNLVAPAFEPTHRVVLFDYIGAGRSDRSAYDRKRYASLQGYADDVLRICEALSLYDVVFVGHSVSSMIGLLASNERPDRFSHLVMVGPSPCYVNEEGYVGGFERRDLDGLLSLMDSNSMSWAGFLAGAVMKNPERPELAASLETSFCATDPSIVRQFAEVTFFSDHRADLERCSTPSLIMQCSDDSIAPVEVGRYLHRHLPGSTYRQLRATGHCPHVSHPTETVEAIRRYLA